jgi:hypothetical protein
MQEDSTGGFNWRIKLVPGPHLESLAGERRQVVGGGPRQSGVRVERDGNSLAVHRGRRVVAVQVEFEKVKV